MIRSDHSCCPNLGDKKLRRQTTIDTEAQAAMVARDWLRASDLWTRARTARPDNLRAHTQGIEALVRAYRFEEAFTLAEAAEDRFAGRSSADLTFAELDARRGRWAIAADRYENIASRSEKLAAQIARLPTYRQSVFNTYGICEGSRRLAPALHEPGHHSADGRRRVVFVSGMPRAGTTALGHILNTRQDVALFIELHNPYLTYGYTSFLPEVVERKRKRLPRVATQQLLARFDKARFIGDKRPLFHYSLPHTFQMMQHQNVSVFHILRHPLLVAASYKRRAADPEDEWDPLRNLGNCIDELNVMHRFLLEWQGRAKMRPNHQLIYVDYDQVFRNVDYALDLFRAIGANGPEASRGAVNRILERSAQVLNKTMDIDTDTREAVVAGLDHNAARRVSKMTGIDITIGPACA